MHHTTREEKVLLTKMVVCHHFTGTGGCNVIYQLTQLNSFDEKLYHKRVNSNLLLFLSNLVNTVLKYIYFCLLVNKRRRTKALTLYKMFFDLNDNLLQTFEDIDLFSLIGVICGLAIYNLTIVELHFPVALYKKLLKRKPTLDDLTELMPDVGRSDQATVI